MRREWALDLDMMSIRVMARDVGQWHVVATQPLENEDFASELAGLLEEHDVSNDVRIFLPRSQILYRSVDVSSLDQASAEIEQILSAETPYDVEELEFDWELETQSSARVAAIALETLDEARAFVEQLGLRVIGYSSLATSEDFPRRPDFGADDAVALLDAGEKAPDPTSDEAFLSPDDPSESGSDAADMVQFSSKRETQASDPLPLNTATPVIEVEDSTPVLSQVDVAPQLSQNAPAKLTGPSRVATDLPIAGSTDTSGLDAARTLSRGLQGAALSRPLRTPLEMPSKALLGVAIALTLGVAVIAWSVMPTAPDDSQYQAPAATERDNVAFQPDVPYLTTTDVFVPAGPGLAPSVPGVDGTFVTPPLLSTLTQPQGSDAPQIQSDDYVVLPEMTDVVSLLGSVSVEPNTPSEIAALRAVTRATLSTLPQQSVSSELPPDLTTSGALETPLPRRPLTLAGVEEFEPDALGATPSDVAEGGVEIATVAVQTALPDLTVLGPAPNVNGLPRLETQTPEPTSPQLTALEQEIVVPEAIEILPLEDETIVETQVPSQDISEEADTTGPVPTELASSVPATPPTPRPERIVAEAAERAALALLPRPTELAASVPDTPPPTRPERTADAQLASEESAIDETPEVATADDAAQVTSEQSIDVALVPAIRPRARPALPDLPAPTPEVSIASNTTELAVSQAPNPRARPGNLAQRAAEARAASVRSPDTSAAVTAALAPAEPQNTPRRAILPSSRTAAEAATVSDAIRLNRLNLIGVFGVPSDRRALVRLPSGRFVRLKVGDRVDGGRVANISDSRLSYVKGNDTIVLEVPSG